MEDHKHKKAPTEKVSVTKLSEEDVKNWKDTGKLEIPSTGMRMEGAVVAALFNLATTNLEKYKDVRDELWKMLYMINDIQNSGFDGVSFNIEVGNPSKLTFIFPKVDIKGE